MTKRSERRREYSQRGTSVHATQQHDKTCMPKWTWKQWLLSNNHIPHSPSPPPRLTTATDQHSIL